MEYRKPQIVAHTYSLDAVQSGTRKIATPTENAQGSIFSPTVNAYEADE